MDWVGRRVLIIGAARQGLALAQFLADRGARVLVNDIGPAARFEQAREDLHNRPIEWVFGEHPLRLLDGVDMVCPSGGVPLDLPIIREAKRRNLTLSNDSQIFLETAPCRVIGITGSAGKSTTTALVGRMAALAEQMDTDISHSHYCEWRPAKTWIGGNLGNPLVGQVDRMRANDLAVLELSSFQLELMNRSPQIAAVLNLSPNHLDRHGSMEAYTAAKARILHFQTADDHAVLGRDDLGAWAFSHRVRGEMSSFGLSSLPVDGSGTVVRAGILCAVLAGVEVTLFPVDEVQLRGAHNVLNVLAACAIALAAGLPLQAIREAAVTFAGLPHRLEQIAEWGGAAWFNDSIATTPERTIAALRSFDRPLILLAGGRDKGLPWGGLAALIRERVDHLIAFGESADLIVKAVAAAGGQGSLRSLIGTDNLQAAVQHAARLAEPGHVVLLSPGGTSFDEFTDFEERGEQFTQWVMDLL